MGGKKRKRYKVKVPRQSWTSSHTSKKAATSKARKAVSIKVKEDK